jgi:hypothetical protein
MMPLLLLPIPALVQADPELVLISLFPILEREAWVELMDRSQVLLDGRNIGEGTRAKLRWMFLRGLAGAVNRRKVDYQRAETILRGMKGQLVAFPLRPLGSKEGWILASDGLSALSQEASGSTVHADLQLFLDPATPRPMEDVVAEGTLNTFEVRHASFSSSRLTLRFIDGRFLKP